LECLPYLVNIEEFYVEARVARVIVILRSILRSLSGLGHTREQQPCLSNRYTNWDDFRHLVNEKLTLKVSLKTEENIQAAAKIFNDTIQWAGWNATPEHTDILATLDCPIQIKQ
jgi:hypothetical protein